MPDPDINRIGPILAAARSLTFEDARVLSRLYDDDPGSGAGLARKHADAELLANGLKELRVTWLRTAGSAVIEAQSADPWDATHDEPWRWATQTILDAVRAEMASPYLSEAEVAALTEPLRVWQGSERGAS